MQYWRRRVSWNARRISSSRETFLFSGAGRGRSKKIEDITREAPWPGPKKTVHTANRKKQKKKNYFLQLNNTTRVPESGEYDWNISVPTTSSGAE